MFDVAAARRAVEAREQSGKLATSRPRRSPGRALQPLVDHDTIRDLEARRHRQFDVQLDAHALNDERCRDVAGVRDDVLQALFAFEDR